MVPGVFARVRAEWLVVFALVACVSPQFRDENGKIVEPAAPQNAEDLSPDAQARLERLNPELAPAEKSEWRIPETLKAPPAPEAKAAPAPVAAVPAKPVFPTEVKAVSVVTGPMSIEDTRPDARRDFERAKALFDAGQENQALTSLADFSRRYPKDPRIGEAQFYMGEIHYHQRNFTEAAKDFTLVKASGADGGRRPDASVRLGESLHRLGRRLEAEIEWNAVIRRYPESSAAERAKTLLKGM